MLNKLLPALSILAKCKKVPPPMCSHLLAFLFSRYPLASSSHFSPSYVREISLFRSGKKASKPFQCPCPTLFFSFFEIPHHLLGLESWGTGGRSPPPGQASLSDLYDPSQFTLTTHLHYQDSLAYQSLLRLLPQSPSTPTLW